MSSNKSTIWRLLSFTTFKIRTESSRADPDLRRIITLTNTLDVNLHRLDLLEEDPRALLLQSKAETGDQFSDNAMSADDPNSSECSNSSRVATDPDHLSKSDDGQDLYNDDPHSYPFTGQASDKLAILHAGDILIQETPPRFLQSCRGSHLPKSNPTSTVTDRCEFSILHFINSPGSRRKRRP